MPAFRSPTAMRFLRSPLAGALSYSADSDSPYSLPNNAAAYSLSGDASNASYLVDGSNRLYYVADRSGNSAVNGLVLPGVAGNTASTPSSVPLSITGDLGAYVRLASDTWNTTPVQILISKRQSGTEAYQFVLSGTTLQLGFFVGAVFKGAYSATAAVPFAAFATGYVGFTRNGTTGTIKFWTSTNGVSWSQLGTDVAGDTGAIDATAAPLQIGAYQASTNVFAGIIYEAKVFNSVTGPFTTAPVFWANFTTVSKLATSFTESSSNAATVTINATAIALPARIHGARDLYQGLTASMPTFSVSGGYNIATFDGTADYMKSAPYSLSQPESVYFVGSQVTWTNTDILYDGNAVDSRILYQKTTTPALATFAGSVAAIDNTTLALGTTGVITGVFNGASSSLRVNTGTATTGSIGAVAASGFTLGARAGGTQWANITWSQTLLRSVADDTALSTRIIRYFMRLGGIS